MYREIMHDALVLLIPLTEEEQRKIEYLDDTLTDGQWEVREIGQDTAAVYAKEGEDQALFSQHLCDVVVHLFDALDTVTQDEADEYAEQAEQE